MLHMVFWSYAPTSLVLANLEEVSDALDRLAKEEWELVREMLPHPWIWRRYRSGNVSSVESSQLIANKLPVRVAYCLAECTPSIGERIFLSNFVEGGGDHVAGIRQRYAFSAALKEKLSWTKALEIVRETYKAGFAYEISGSNVSIPDHVADEVVSKAGDYPAELWDIAHGRLAARHGRTVRPVAEVAKKEKWF